MDEGNAGKKEGRTGECHSWRRKKHKRYKECEVKRRKRNGWRREECAERVEERREEQERIDETKRQRRETRGLVAAQTRSIRLLSPTSQSPTSTTTRYRTRRATWSPNVYAPDTQWDLFVSFFRPSVPASLSPSPFASRYFFHPSQCALNDPPFWEVACSHFPSTSSQWLRRTCCLYQVQLSPSINFASYCVI